MKLNKVFELTGGLCWYCGGEAVNKDHITPKAKGGSNAQWNLVPACKFCNSSKGKMDLEEFRSFIKMCCAKRIANNRQPRKSIVTIMANNFKFYFELQQLSFPSLYIFNTSLDQKERT